MFVLQECSICFEDFDAERNPHSIPCGHVFCHPCLDSLASSPNCPNCRIPYTPDSIRKVVCAHQENDTSTQNASSESDAETLMWQAIQSSVEAPTDYEQRKSLVRHNPPETVREAGLSANLVIALDVMQLLVKMEQRNHALKDKVDTARAVEESLCDRISTLEAQLSAKAGGSSASSHDVQSLVSDVRALRASIQLIKADTSNIARHFTEPASPALARDPPITPDTPPDHTIRAKPTLLRKPSPQTSPIDNRGLINPPQCVQVPTPRQEYFPHLRAASTGGSGQTPRSPSIGGRTPSTSGSLPRTPSTSGAGQTTPRQLHSPPVTPAAVGRPLFGPSSPMMKRNVSVTTGYEGGPLPSLPDPQSPRTPHPNNWVVFPDPDESARPPSLQPTTQTSPTTPLRAHPKPPAPKPAPRTITAAFTFTGTSATELSFTEGQTLHLSPESDLSPGKDWVWCRTATGVEGYAPRSYLRV